MAGNILSKFLLSIFSDRMGEQRSAEVVLMIIMTGFIFLLLPAAELFLYIGAFFLGASASMIPIVIPQITSVVYRGETFDVVYSKYSTILSMASAVWVSVIGLLYTWLGSYRMIFTGGFFLAAASVGLLHLFIKK